MLNALGSNSSQHVPLLAAAVSREEKEEEEKEEEEVPRRKRDWSTAWWCGAAVVSVLPVWVAETRQQGGVK